MSFRKILLRLTAPTLQIGYGIVLLVARLMTLNSNFDATDVGLTAGTLGLAGVMWLLDIQ